MKPKLPFLIVLFAVFTINALRANNAPIPVMANESITVTLFFPTEITKVIEPAVNYKFEYEKNATMATLVARKGANSNLTVITKCGSIFSFLLKYNNEVDNFTYVLSAENAIGKLGDSGAVAVPGTPDKIVYSETKSTVPPAIESISVKKPEKKKRPTKVISDGNYGEQLFTDKYQKKETPIEQGNSLYEIDRNEYYQIFCENNYKQKSRLRKTNIAGSDVTLQLRTVTADKNELYFIVEVNNTLDTEFQSQNLDFYVRTGQNDAPLTVTPLYVFNAPNNIAPNGKVNVVYVFKEFRLATNQKMYIVMDEKGGSSKRVMLKVDSKTINSAAN